MLNPKMPRLKGKKKERRKRDECFESWTLIRDRWTSVFSRDYLLADSHH